MQQRNHCLAAAAVDELASGLAGNQQDVPALVGAILDAELVVGPAVEAIGRLGSHQ